MKKKIKSRGGENQQPLNYINPCVFPPALAESPDLLHEPQKANFADAIWANISNKDVEIPKPAQYIIDGRALLHRIP